MQGGRLRQGMSRAGRKLLWAIGMSVAAQVFSLPIVLDVFGRATPGLLFNLIWLPVLGMIVLPASWVALFLLMLGWDGGGDLLLRLALMPCSWLSEGMAVLEQWGWLSTRWSLRPHWAAMIGYGALCAAGAAWYGQDSRRAARLFCFAGLVLVLTGPALRLGGALNRDVSLTLVDVGQGQAVILEWPGGRGVVDGGGFSSSRFDSGRDILAPLLTANRAPQLDFVAASHMDRDHVGGLFFCWSIFPCLSICQGRRLLPNASRKR